MILRCFLHVSQHIQSEIDILIRCTNRGSSEIKCMASDTKKECSIKFETDSVNKSRREIKIHLMMQLNVYSSFCCASIFPVNISHWDLKNIKVYTNITVGH